MQLTDPLVALLLAAAAVTILLGDIPDTPVSLVVAAVPESLPAVVTLALALGARRMALQHAIPRRLHAVETLGSVTVAASDKTGTLTEGRMAAQRVVSADGLEYAVAGTGYEPTGEITDPDGVCEPPLPDALIRLARAGLLCNDAALIPPTVDDPQWSATGDPLEAALVALAARCGLDPYAERAAWPRVDEHHFETHTRRMTTAHDTPAGDYLVVCKGAPENVLVDGLVVATPAELTAATEAAHTLAAGGLRVVAVAAATVPPAPDPAAPHGLRPLGLIGIGDRLASPRRTSRSPLPRRGSARAHHRRPLRHRRRRRRTPRHLAGGRRRRPR